LLYLICAVWVIGLKVSPQPSGGRMTLRMQEQLDEPDSTTFVLSGRIRSEHVLHLASLLEQERGRIVLDLKEVTLVNREAVRFLAACETKGSVLRNCPAFVREWILIERSNGASMDIATDKL
jgi:hypothetical protein